MAKPVVETGCRLIENLLGRPAKVAGNLLADEVYAWQWANRVRIANRAKEIMDRNKVAARVVPKGFLLPLVEAAGDIEDLDLQEMWAQLLASGVSDDENQHPMFVDTLRRLSRSDAICLRELAGRRWSYRDELRRVMGPPPAPANEFRFYRGSQRGAKEAARLQSLGLLVSVLVANKAPLGPGTAGMDVTARGTEISAYGWQFVRAVMPDVTSGGRSGGSASTEGGDGSSAGTA